MIDTIKLFIEDYSIKDDANLIVQPASIDYKTGKEINSYSLIVKENNTSISGSKAYLNTDFFNFTIKPIGKSENKSVAAFLQFSIPKIYNGSSNYYPVSSSNARAVIQRVEKELQSNGVFTDLSQAKLSRVDLFKNVISEYDFLSYIALFRLLKASRQEQRIYGTSLLWHNSQHEISVYDKLKEMRNRNLIVDLYPSNTIRFEYRLLRSKKVKNIIGANKLIDLLDSYNLLEDVYQKALKKTIFSHSVSDVETMVNIQLKEELNLYKNTCGVRWFNSFLKSKGIETLLKHHDLDSLDSIFSDVFENRTKKSRAMNLISTEMLKIKMIAKEKRSNVTFAELYSELKGKVLYAA